MNRKVISIKCPVCSSGRIIDASEKADRKKLVTYKPEEFYRAEWFVKCPKCASQIGISFLHK